MKIAVPGSSPDLHGALANRLGGAAHLLVVESDDMSFEALECPEGESGAGAGVMVMALVVKSGAKVLLAGHAAPHIVAALENRGVEVVLGLSGSVEGALAGYLAAGQGVAVPGADGTDSDHAADEDSGPWGRAVKTGLRQFSSMVPRLIGVVLLLGLIRGFVSREALFSLFAGVPFWDALWGSVMGSVLVGNPVNSYVIGESLLKAGVSLTGALALMMAWVTVGLVQLPMEAEALGMRFAVIRNTAGFVMAVGLSLVVGMWL